MLKYSENYLPYLLAGRAALTGVTSPYDLFLTRGRVDPLRVKSTLLRSLAHAPAVDVMLNRVLTDPTAFSIVENLRKNPILRSKILGQSPETAMVFRDLEDRLLGKRFQAHKLNLLRNIGGAQAKLGSEIRRDVQRKALMEEFAKEMSKQTKPSRKPADPEDVLAAMHSRGMDVKPIAKEVTSLTEKVREKPGLSIIHGNVDVGRFRNLMTELQSRARTSSSAAQEKEKAFQKLEKLKGKAQRMKQKTTSPGPKFDISKFNLALKRSSLELFTTDSIVEASKYTPTRVITEKKVDIDDRIAELKREVELSEKEEASKSEKEKPVSLLKYFIDLSSKN